MAEEIKVRTEVTITKDEIDFKVPSEVRKSDLTGDRVFRDAPSIPTTAAGTLISLGSLSTYGLAVFLNLDDTNFIEIGLQVTGTFYPFSKLMPGQQRIEWLGTGTIYARADTAAVKLDIQAVER